jgi:Family of unknown function (DUF5908)
MPIEIKELHIKVEVSTAQGGGQNAAPSAPQAAGGTGDKDAIVAECVEQVMQILQTKLER